MSFSTHTTYTPPSKNGIDIDIHFASMYLSSPRSYQARLFSRKWLQSKGLESAIPDHLQKYIVLD